MTIPNIATFDHGTYVLETLADGRVEKKSGKQIDLK